MTKALLITPELTYKDVDIDTYKDISKFLECQIFCVIPNGRGKPFDLYGDDEGATYAPEFLHRNLFGEVYYSYGPIFGNVLAMGEVDGEGESTDLTEESRAQIIKALDLGRNVLAPWKEVGITP